MSPADSLFPLLPPKDTLEAELAQTVLEVGSPEVVLQKDDFVVSVSAVLTLHTLFPYCSQIATLI